MAAHNFLGSAAGSSTASAVLKIGGGLGFVSAQGNWKLAIVGGEFSLERLIGGAFTQIDGGPCSVADLRALWVGLLSPLAEGNANGPFDGGHWKTLHVSAGTFNLQRFYSAAFHTLSGGTLSGEKLDELRDLLDSFVS